jgi:large subunit ribosomal protein L13
MKTFLQSEQEVLDERKWVVVDAAGQTVGRLASMIAARLRGKYNPKFVSHHDCGDFVVVLNAEKVKFTGKKLDQKVYYHHTGFIGNTKSITAKDLLATKPEKVIEKAVQGMLPKGPLGRNQLSKLKVYQGDSHPHKAQNPQVVSV